jgi:hypothetical protein
MLRVRLQLAEALEVAQQQAAASSSVVVDKGAARSVALADASGAYISPFNIRVPAAAVPGSKPGAGMTALVQMLEAHRAGGVPGMPPAPGSIGAGRRPGAGARRGDSGLDADGADEANEPAGGAERTLASRRTSLYGGEDITAPGVTDDDADGLRSQGGGDDDEGPRRTLDDDEDADVLNRSELKKMSQKLARRGVAGRRLGLQSASSDAGGDGGNSSPLVHGGAVLSASGMRAVLAPPTPGGALSPLSHHRDSKQPGASSLGMAGQSLHGSAPGGIPALPMTRSQLQRSLAGPGRRKVA